MSYFQDKGRLGATPELKWVGKDDDKKPVAELRVRFPNAKRTVNDAGESEFIERGFWTTVSVWGAFAETVAKMYNKGDQVYVIGKLYQESWPDKETGEERTGLKIDARMVFPWAPDLESLKFKQRKAKDSDDPSSDDDLEDDGEPF